MEYYYCLNPRTNVYEQISGLENKSIRYLYKDITSGKVNLWNESRKTWTEYSGCKKNTDDEIVVNVIQQNKRLYTANFVNNRNTIDWLDGLVPDYQFECRKEKIDYNKALSTFQKHRKETDFEKSLYCYEIIVNYDTYEIQLIENYEIVDIIVNEDKSIPPLHFTKRYKFNLKSGSVSNDRVRNTWRSKEIPENVIDAFMSLFCDVRDKWAGRRVSINSNYTGLEYVKAATLFPYEPNLALLDWCYSEVKKLNRCDPEAYNKLCKALKIKSFTSLRKLYLENPEIIYAYKYLKDAGFKDRNVMIEILKNTDLIRINNCPENFIFFMREYLKRKPEKSALRFINKASYENYYDSLEMFNSYRKYVAESVVNDLINDGFTDYNHDVLAKLSQIVEQKLIDFDYTDRELKYETEINGYKFIIPKNTGQLIQVGIDLRNCVASYCKKILAKRCVIVYAEKNGKKKICIEINGNTIVQTYGYRNSRLDSESREVMDLWIDKFNLNDDTV